MNVNTKPLIAGIILIAIGLVVLGDNLGLFYLSWDTFWPWFMIIGGVLFLLGWMNDREKYGMLMPASVLLVYGFLFLYSSYDGWWRMDELWPFFLIGPGIGFLMMYFLGKKENGLLVPATILLGLGSVFLIGSGTPRFFWPILLIILGALLLFKSRRREEDIPEAEEIAEEIKEEPEPESKKTKKKK